MEGLVPEEFGGEPSAGTSTFLHGREAERRTQVVSTSPMPVGLGS